MKRSILLLTFLLLLIAAGILIVANRKAEAPATSTQQSESTPSPKEVKKTDETPKEFNKKRLSTTNPASYWIVVNKRSPLQPLSYKPVGLKTVSGNTSALLRSEAASSLEKMFADAKTESINLKISSAYRSYSTQVSVYNNWVKTLGQKSADTQSARPGYSEHQTGLAVDIEPSSGKCRLEQCFGTLPEGKWLRDNAHKYGFVLRYPEAKQHITGYIYEPWHFRYVGSELSNEIKKNSDITLEEFFELPPAPDYN